MKAVNDFKIKVSDIPFYQTGNATFYQYQPVYYTGILPGTYTENGITEGVSGPFSTGYYYCKQDLSASLNYFYNRPDSELGKNFWTQDWQYTPTYGSSVSFSSNLYSIYFGENYLYNVSKNENSLVATAQLKFDGISDLEAKSIVHYYQNNSLTEASNNKEGLKPVDMSFYPPFTKLAPCYITNIDYQYVYDNVNNLTVNVDSPFISLANWDGKLIPNRQDQNYSKDKTYFRHDYIFETEGNPAERGSWYQTGIGGTRGDEKPYHNQQDWTNKFYFRPDSSNGISIQSKTYKNQQDRFYLMQKDSDNPNLLVLNLSFTKRKDKEAKALLHFLEEKNGVDVFKFDGVPNMTGSMNFFCPQWSHTYNFKDNNTISATFVEVLYGPSEAAVFNTKIFPDANGLNLDNLVSTSAIDFGYVPSGFAVTKDLTFYNSGSDDVTYLVEPIKIFDEKDSNSVGLIFNNKTHLDKVTLAPLESGYISYTYYVTDAPAGDFIVTGPTSYRGTHVVKEYAPEKGEINNNYINVYLTGRSDASYDVYASTNLPAGTGPQSNSWLGWNQYCIMSPGYDEETRTVKGVISWKPPETGYFFEDFTVDLSEQSNFSSVTSKTVNVERIDDSILGGYLYGGYNGIADRYTTEITNLSLDTTYYVRVRGHNDSYSAYSYYTYATGVWDQDFNIKNQEIKDGYISAPIPIHWGKIFDIIYLPDPVMYNIDVHSVIRERGTFKDNFDLYSGINLVIGPYSKVGSRGEDSDLTGALIITGDYSAMASGLTITLSDSQVYGFGGRPCSDGGTAIYVRADGDIRFVINDNTIIGGGGGGGCSLFQSEVEEQINSNQAKTELGKVFFNSYEVYGGYGAGFATSQRLYKNQKVFVSAPDELRGSDGYTLIVNDNLENSAFVVDTGE